MELPTKFGHELPTGTLASTRWIVSWDDDGNAVKSPFSSVIQSIGNRAVDIPALRQIVPSAGNTVCFVKGSAESPGGGYWWIVAVDGTVTDNGGTLIVPNNNGSALVGDQGYWEQFI